MTDKREITEDIILALIAPAASKWESRPEHWISGGNEGLSYCPKCCRKEIRRLLKENPKGGYEIDGGWGTEGDRIPFCETCGVVLDNSLGEDGGKNELINLEEGKFDLASPDNCYTLREILSAQVWGEGPLAERIMALCGRIIASAEESGK